MSSAGHVLDMIKRLRNNKILLNKHKKFQNYFSYKKHIKINPEKLKSISSEEKERIKIKILKQEKIQFIKRLIAFFIALSAAVLLMYFLLFSEISVSDEFLF